MTLYEHAERELGLVNCDEGKKAALLAAVKGFATDGWSGGSVGWGIETLVRLLSYKPLTPITSEPSEWVEVGGPTIEHLRAERLWQNARRSTSFSRDGGRTWYDIEDPELNNGDVWKREEGDWEPVELGSNVNAGSRVRVRQDAYSASTSLANAHNGRTGELVLVDSGRCSVKYDDGTLFRHDPTRLEVLKAAP